MYKTLLLLPFLLFILMACGEGSTPSSVSPPIVIPSRMVTTITWPSAVREDSMDGTASGYIVYCATGHGYQIATIKKDVGDVTSYPLSMLIVDNGLWYCSVAPYDTEREYARQGEASVKKEDGVFYLP